MQQGNPEGASTPKGGLFEGGGGGLNRRFTAFTVMPHVFCRLQGHSGRQTLRFTLCQVSMTLRSSPLIHTISEGFSPTMS